MKLEEFLRFIQDEDVRLELEIDEPQEDEYKYVDFWLSDYRVDCSEATKYKDYEVNGISFLPNQGGSEMVIIVTP